LVKIFNEKHPTLSLKNPGTYVAKLTVTDSRGASARKSLQITAGNEPPMVSINLTEGNQTFAFPGSKIKYDVKVTDKEDGSLEAGTIIKNNINFSIDYQTAGKKQLVEEWGHQEQEMGNTKALVLMRASDCLACHDTHKKSIGPTFMDIAHKYNGDKSASVNLVKKVINGGSGVWGQIAMSSHPDLKIADTKVIIDYILNLNSEHNRPQPLSDTFFIKVPDADQANNLYQYVFKASYIDQRAGTVPSNFGKALLILRAPRLSAAEATFTKSVMHLKPVSSPEELTMLYGPHSYIGFSKIDLSDIGEIYLNGSGQDSIEVHMDSPEGPLIGRGNQLLKEERSLNGKNGPTFKVQLKEVRGVHDLYFVSRDTTNDPSRITLTLRTIDFKRRQKNP
jgi:cytochrome c